MNLNFPTPVFLWDAVNIYLFYCGFSTPLEAFLSGLLLSGGDEQ
jgi:hypothetical protein